MASLSFDIFARDHASKKFDEAGDNAERLGRRLSGVGTLASGLGTRLSVAGTRAGLLGVSALVSAAKLAGLAAAAGSAASSVAGLAAALAPAVGALAALPAVAVLGAGAIGTLKLATAGLGNAFSKALGDDLEKFEKSLVGLSPAAAAMARELRALKPVFDEFKHGVQDAFTGPLLGQITALTQTLGGPLRDGMSALSAEFARLALGAAEFGRSSAAVSLVERAFQTLKATVEGFQSGTLQRLLTALARFTSSTLPAFAGLGSGIDRLAGRFADWLDKATAAGKGMEWIGAAMEVLRQLGQVAADAGGILRAVFTAMRASGVGALGVVGQLLEGMNRFAGSAQGQQILIQVFTALRDIGTAFLPVIRAVISGVGALAPVVAGLAQAVGPILTGAIKAVVPALAALGPGLRAVFAGVGQAVRGLAPALAPLGAAIGAAFGALRPLIAAIGPAIAALLPGVREFIKAFAVGVAALAPALVPIGGAIGGVFKAVAPLLPVLGALAQIIATSLAGGVKTITPGLAKIADGFGRMVMVLAPLIPQIVHLAAIFLNDVLTAVAPLLPVLGQIAGVLGQFLVEALRLVVEAVRPLLPALSQIAVTVGLALVEALREVAPLLLDLIRAWVQLLPTLTPLLPLLGQMAIQLMPVLVDVLKLMAPHARQMAIMTVQLVRALLPLAPIFLDLAIKSLPLATRLLEIGMAVSKKLLPAFERFAPVVADVVDRVVGAFLRLYDRLVGHSIIPDLVDGIREWIGRLPGMFADLVGRAARAAVEKFGDLVDWVKGLPGKIVEAIGGLGSLLGGVGRDLITGLWDGVKGMWGWFRDKIVGFFRGIMPDWVRKALGIASPSRLFAEIGRQLPAGMALGIDAGAGLVKAAAGRLAGTATVGVSPVVAPMVPPGGTVSGAPGGSTVVNFTINFAGQPLTTRDEIARVVMQALADARGRGFNVQGAVVGT